MKWLLAIPHYIVLIVLWVVAIVVTVLAWFAILITGRYPRPLFDFVLGVSRWSLRVEAYMWLLTTDRYPPFRLGAVGLDRRGGAARDAVDCRRGSDEA